MRLSVIQPLDRRVQLLDGTDRTREMRVSELRETPFVVLLGEPGSGKSSVLQMEAELAGASKITVRTFINDAGASYGPSLFLDALDEYRIDGQDADKVQRVSQALTSSSVARWRLTCRSEDWRKGTDLAALQRAASGTIILVAKLLPLDGEESATLLTAFGESNPVLFISKAESLGASSLLRSPLSLRLLYQVVSQDGRWPDTRYELFDAAVTSLAHEHNDDYKYRERTSPSDILAAAEAACLLFLVSGARAIWRSNSESPRRTVGDVRAYLTAHDLRLEHRVVTDMLDTGLFTGEGEEFEPLHRAIAEYLAGRALAKLVKGSVSRPGFPLTRTVAMITSDDGAPPSELRGLYAWFAAHLSRQGDCAAAVRLIEADAATVLFYGDAAAFGTEERRAILQHLDRHDPCFRAVESPDSVIGGLAQQDLAADFARVLNGSPTDFESHRVSTVFDALASGKPIPELRSLLYDIALDTTRSEWHRGRAADVWLTYPETSARQLFDALEPEPPSLTRAILRLHLAAQFAAELTATEVRALLSDFELTPDDNTVGRLTAFADALSGRAVPGLFDIPVRSWLPESGTRRHSVELEHILDSLLISSMRATPDLSATQLWSWITNLRGSIWLSLDERARQAVTEWLGTDIEREIALFDAIASHDGTQEKPWLAPNAFITATRRTPSAAAMRALSDRAAKVPTSAESARIRAMIVEVIRHSDDAALYLDTERQLQMRPEDADLLERLRSGPVDRQRAKAEEHEQKRDDDTREARETNLSILGPLVDELMRGLHAHHLRWAANVYFDRRGMAKEDDGNIERLRTLTDDATLEAILVGWDYLATRELIGADVEALAKADAENRMLYVEAAAFAGLHRCFKQDDPPTLDGTPITAAFVTLRSRARLRDPRMRERMLTWALDRIDFDADIGADNLYRYWLAGLDAGGQRCDPLWYLGEIKRPRAAVATALDNLLRTRPSIAASPLEMALRAALVHLPAHRLRQLASDALTTIVETGPQRRIWSLTAFMLDPQKERQRFLLQHRDDAGTLFTEDIHEPLVTALRGIGSIEAAAAAEREAAIITILGRGVVRWDDPEGWYRSGPTQFVRTAIQLLSSGSMPNAGALLKELADDPQLVGWRSALRHARASWAAVQRENNFRHPSVADVQAAIQGGPPLSSGDLLAVVWEELVALGTELITSENSSWKLYWNVDQWGRAKDPVIENECRSRLLERLTDRLKRYGVVATIPEAQRREGTRADMLFLSHAGRTLPVEVKRHYHEDMWTASGDQLLGYAQTRGSDGFGIYLVFWFGNDIGKPPSRPDGRRADSARQLESLLNEDLPVETRNYIRVIVFDVSRLTRDAMSG